MASGAIVAALMPEVRTVVLDPASHRVHVVFVLPASAIIIISKYVKISHKNNKNL